MVLVTGRMEPPGLLPLPDPGLLTGRWVLTLPPEVALAGPQRGAGPGLRLARTAAHLRLGPGH